jgi:hypothetical protein
MSTLHLKVPAWKGTTNTRNSLNKSNNGKTKICYLCEQEKNYEEFSSNKSRRDGLQTYCKQCGFDKQTEWYYKRKHGISLDERDRLLQAQGYMCLICKNPISFKKNKGRGLNTGNEAVVDHCHSSKKIRGILCGHCNTGLGAFKDNVNSLYYAIEYLQKYE